MSRPDVPQLAATAERLRHEAELVDLVGRVLADADGSLPAAAAGLVAVATAKRVGADHLDEMAQEAS